MTRRTGIAAIEAQAPETGETQGIPGPQAEAVTPAEEAWWEEPAAAPRRSWGLVAANVLTALAVIGWTTVFVMANQAEMLGGASLAQWTAWIRDWSVPVLLIALVWQLGMRNSKREAARFSDTARSLGEESARLEERLLTVNRELSLAREFVAAQSRDIESIGRIASERLSDHATHLSGLVAENSDRIEMIGAVSTAALENMERLRSQLPVIANSAKDVTNNIASAGQAARNQIEEMIAGFNKLNQFGQASERQVNALRTLVDETVAEFTRQSEVLREKAEHRFAELARHDAEFSASFAEQESTVLAALRSRIDEVRSQSLQVIEDLRSGESQALDNWRSAIERLEGDLRAAVERVSEIDAKALETARNRLAELSEEAAGVDARMSERDQLFSEEIERRQAEFDRRHQSFVAKLGEQMAELDQLADRHRQAQAEHGRSLAEHSEAIAAKLEGYTAQMAEIAAHGGTVEEKVSSSLSLLADKLAASRESMAGADSALTTLTDNSVRLLELIQASVQHSTRELPAAMSTGEAKLAEIEARVAGLSAAMGQASEKGEAVSAALGQSNGQLGESLEQIRTLHEAIAGEGERQAEALTAMRQSLEAIRGESLALAEQAQGDLVRAIEDLNQAAKGAAATLTDMSKEAIAATAAKLGEESREAIDKAMRMRAAEVSGQLEEAVAHAAGAGREAAIQLRDQLAKVNELAGNLEHRVAHARARAEEQVDNDFARRVALITESLNSNAIDIARALDSEVSDTAWAAYLKGDRGIFTRRALGLLDTGEAKSVVQLYEGDRDFREHVSRYIHDFEAMLRQVLSTRDGHALGVTLLSSDMGKLYVALAQAIERLRN